MRHLQRYFDGEALYGQAQFSDLDNNLRIASHAHMLGREADCEEHFTAARTRSLARSNLSLGEFLQVVEKDCDGMPDAESRMSLVRRYVNS